ncbi:hypothetical protein [Planctomicrobium piriforme]|nr:hypothetical protein [Planctomicrobium piriforme]
MNEQESANQDAGVAMAAVAALNAAQQRAIQSGRPVVFVRADQLVRVVGSEKEVVIKQMPKRIVVKNQVKRIK